MFSRPKQQTATQEAPTPTLQEALERLPSRKDVPAVLELQERWTELVARKRDLEAQLETERTSEPSGRGLARQVRLEEIRDQLGRVQKEMKEIRWEREQGHKAPPSPHREELREAHQAHAARVGAVLEELEQLLEEEGEFRAAVTRAGYRPDSVTTVNGLGRLRSVVGSMLEELRKGNGPE